MKLDGGASLTLITSSIYSSRRSKKNQGNINELACVQITETRKKNYGLYAGHLSSEVASFSWL